MRDVGYLARGAPAVGTHRTVGKPQPQWSGRLRLGYPRSRCCVRHLLNGVTRGSHGQCAVRRRSLGLARHPLGRPARGLDTNRVSLSLGIPWLMGEGEHWLSQWHPSWRRMCRPKGLLMFARFAIPWLAPWARMFRPKGLLRCGVFRIPWLAPRARMCRR